MASCNQGIADHKLHSPAKPAARLFTDFLIEASKAG
jgi:hypothetical protein